MAVQLPDALRPLGDRRQDLRRGPQLHYGDAVCNLGVADWHGREAIRQNLRNCIDRGFTAHHEVVEYLDSPLLKMFHGSLADEEQRV